MLFCSDLLTFGKVFGRNGLTAHHCTDNYLFGHLLRRSSIALSALGFHSQQVRELSRFKAERPLGGTKRPLPLMADAKQQVTAADKEEKPKTEKLKAEKPKSEKQKSEKPKSEKSEKPKSEKSEKSKSEKPKSEKAMVKDEKEKGKDEKSGAGAGAAGGAEGVEEEWDPNEYFAFRTSQVEAWRAAGENPYPHKFHVSISLGELLERYNSLAPGETRWDEELSVAGRLHAKREYGKKLVFYDLRGEGSKVQVMCSLNAYGREGAAAARGEPAAEAEAAFLKVNERVRRGDVVGVRGWPAKTKKGELSVVPRELVLLTPCLVQLPHMYYGLKDKVNNNNLLYTYVLCCTLYSTHMYCTYCSILELVNLDPLLNSTRIRTYGVWSFIYSVLHILVYCRWVYTVHVQYLK